MMALSLLWLSTLMIHQADSAVSVLSSNGNWQPSDEDANQSYPNGFSDWQLSQDSGEKNFGLPGYRPPYSSSGTPLYRPPDDRRREAHANYFFRGRTADRGLCRRWSIECRNGFRNSCDRLRGDCAALNYCDALRESCNRNPDACFMVQDAC